MQKLDNKVKLPELSGIDHISIKPSEKAYSKLLVAAFCLFVLVVLVVGILVNSYLDDIMANPGSNIATPNLDNAYWRVRTVTATPGKTDSYTLELKSSIGNLRTYEGVRAYGISSSGKYLAMTSSRGLEVINLAENTAQMVNTPFDIAGDLGETISWSHNDSYFAVPAFNKEEDAAHLLLFSQNGTTVKDYTPNLAYKREGDNIVMYPVLFSPVETRVLVRSFNDADTSTSVIKDKAVILTVVDLDGKNVWEYDARNSSNNTEVIYNWSVDGKYAYFAVVPNNTVINYANQNLFTKVLVETN